uniref:Putative transcriptional regulatory protein PB24D3.01 n=1 Tax=Talaromyces marneffei PM1 TaxID=1077442 RepID=A0A093X7Z8_TALMA
MQSSVPPARTSSSPRIGSYPIQAKRKRKTLSCYECRRRKLKCDREEPSCGRCRKAAQPELCSYLYDVSSLSATRQPSNPPGLLPPSSSAPQQPDPSSHGISSRNHLAYSSLPRVASQFLDISGKEYTPSTVQAVQNQGTWQLLGHVSLAANGAEARPAINADVQMLLRGPRSRSQKKRLFSAERISEPNIMVAATQLAVSLIQTALPRVQRELKSLQVKWKGIRADDAWFLTHDELLQLLPDRETLDRHVNLYFDTVETTYRILHYQSFQKQYELLWQDPNQVNSAVVIILLLVMASVEVLFSHEQPKYIGDSSVSRERAIFWIEVSEKWLARQSYKHMHLAIWQIRCLIVFAKQINVVKKKRIWTESGTLLREAMSAGFHRDPSVLGEKVSFFDQEMRRRLWATIIEMELQISIDRGMPSASAGVPSDTTTVLNVHDEELEKNSRPTSRSLREHTPTSYLHISRSSFSLRVSLNSMINDMSSPFVHETVLDYEDMITKELQRLPSGGGSHRQAHGNGRRTMVRILLDIQLRQFLVMLHAPFARQTQTSSRYSLSRITCLTAAAEIVQLYSDLTQTGNFILLLQRNDYFRAALVICQSAYTNLITKNNLFINSNSAVLIQYLEDVIGMLEQRITQHGTGYTYYWYISAASAFLQSVLLPSESTKEKEEAINRVTKQYYRVLESQEDIGKAKDMIMPVHSTSMTSAKKFDTS